LKPQINDNAITIVAAQTDMYNQPVMASAQTLTLQKESAPIVQSVSSDRRLIINGIPLSKTQIAELEKTYGVKPKPGNYWYDTKSGLYGVSGYQAYGYMYPNHDFGPLQRNASNGNTKVIVNGRELPQDEWAIWSYILGYWIQPGSYWFDSEGNAGYEGNPVPVVNMFTAAKQNTYNGKGSGGDNFWSTRFSAGNYDSGNQRGYVSVPGYGPVGYGFD
jgi:hypothetical protein